MNQPTSLLILFLFTSVICSCKKKNAGPAETVELPVKTVSPTPEHILNNYSVVWNDEFEGTNLDLTKWNYRADGTIRKLATVSKENVKLDGNGNLAIRITKDANGTYYVGQAGTDGLYKTKYGYFECRVKLNTSIGPHVAFWLQSNTMGIENNDPQTNGTEIDIFEYHRKKPNRVFHNLHWNGYGDAHQTIGTVNDNISKLGEGYHTFGLEWTSDQYVFYIDGKESWRTTTAVSQTDQYIILSAELTGFGGEPALGYFPDAVYFDYVRVYKAK